MSASGKSGKGSFQGQGSQGGSQLGGGGSKVRTPSMTAPQRAYNAANDFYGPGPTEPGGRLMVRQPQPGYYSRYPAQVDNYAPPPARPEPVMPKPVIPNPVVPPPFRPGNPQYPPFNPGFFAGAPIGPSDIFGQGGYQPFSGISRPTNPDDLWTGKQVRRAPAPILDRIERKTQVEPLMRLPNRPEISLPDRPTRRYPDSGGGGISRPSLPSYSPYLSNFFR